MYSINSNDDNHNNQHSQFSPHASQAASHLLARLLSTAAIVVLLLLLLLLLFGLLRCMSFVHIDDGANNGRARPVHLMKRLIDLIQREAVRDELIDIDLSLHRLLYQARQLRAALATAECTATPHSPSNQLERPSANLLTRTCHSDDSALAPACQTTHKTPETAQSATNHCNEHTDGALRICLTLVAAFECCAHDADVADAFE